MNIAKVIEDMLSSWGGNHKQLTSQQAIDFGKIIHDNNLTAESAASVGANSSDFRGLLGYVSTFPVKAPMPAQGGAGLTSGAATGAGGGTVTVNPIQYAAITQAKTPAEQSHLIEQFSQVNKMTLGSIQDAALGVAQGMIQSSPTVISTTPKVPNSYPVHMGPYDDWSQPHGIPLPTPSTKGYGYTVPLPPQGGGGSGGPGSPGPYPTPDSHAYKYSVPMPGDDRNPGGGVIIYPPNNGYGYSVPIPGGYGGGIPMPYHIPNPGGGQMPYGYSVPLPIVLKSKSEGGVINDSTRQTESLVAQTPKDVQLDKSSAPSVGAAGFTGHGTPDIFGAGSGSAAMPAAPPQQPRYTN